MADNFSEEQSKVIFSDFKSIALVKAYAGTGKSFTLKQFCTKHSTKTFLYFVYNKSMRIDAQKSFKSITNVSITTFHGIAFQAVGKEYKARLDKEESLKSFDLLKFIDEKDIDPEIKPLYAHALLKTIQNFTSSSDTIDEYIEKHKRRSEMGDIQDEEVLAYVLKKLKVVWEKIIIVDNMSIPFEHDFYLKLFQLRKFKLKYDYILVDEAQDISHVMIDIILNQSHAKKIFVGDTYQSIYSFRGAVNSLEYIEKHYSPSVYLLSQSFRCPPKVAWLANKIIKLAGAQQDFVGVATPAPVSKQKTYIARTNSGLFAFCADNLDKKIHFVGGVQSYSFQDILDVKNLMSQKHEWIRNEFIAKFSDFKELNKYARDMNDISMLGTIGIVLKYMKVNLYELIAEMKESATDKMKDAEIVVTTAHKSKGLEWAQVELIDDFPFASETKMGRADVAEELRLLYVAVTRAMNNVKIPEEILDYLEIEGGREEFLGTVKTKTAPTGEEEEDEVEDEAEHEKLCFCNVCHKGDIYDSRRKLYCNECEFEIAHRKIIGFFTTFQKEITREESAEVLTTIVLRGGYEAKGLMSKQDKPFDARLVLEKNPQYGWGLGFSKDTPAKPQPAPTKTFSKKKTPSRGRRPY